VQTQRQIANIKTYSRGSSHCSTRRFHRNEGFDYVTAITLYITDPSRSRSRIS